MHQSHPIQKFFTPSIAAQCAQVLAEVDACIQDRQLVEAERHVKALLEKVRGTCAGSDPLIRQVLCEYSRVLVLLADYDRTDEVLLEAIQLASHGADHTRIRDEVNNLGRARVLLMSDSGRHQDAIELAATIYGQVERSSPLRASMCLCLAQAYMAIGRKDDYKKFMQEALSIADTPLLPKAREFASVFSQAGIRESMSGRFASAATLGQTASRLLGSLGDELSAEVAELEMHAAQEYERAGEFSIADSIRAHTLQEMTARLGSAPEVLIKIREQLAVGLMGHSGGNFERAEALLHENITIARDSSNLDLLIEQQIVLAKAYSARGKYVDALTLFRAAYEHSSAASTDEIQVLAMKEFANSLAECGAFKKAEALYRKAVAETRSIPGRDAKVLLTKLLYSLASIVAENNSEEARAFLAESHDVLDSLAANDQPVARGDLRLMEHSLGEDSTSPEVIEAKATARLRQLQRDFGKSYTYEQAQLMAKKAEALKDSWQLKSAAAELEGARELLEKRAGTRTSLYAMILSRLADVLPPDDSRIFEYRSDAEAILRDLEQVRALVDSWEE